MTGFFIACASLIAVSALLAWRQLAADPVVARVFDIHRVNSQVSVDIRKGARGVYQAQPRSHGVEVTEPSTYDRIEKAICAEASNIPEDFAFFVEFTYGGMSTGTMTIPDAISNASQLADRLMALVAEEHRLIENRAAAVKSELSKHQMVSLG